MERMLLDLGSVSVLAAVTLDVTDILHTGENRLEIRERQRPRRQPCPFPVRQRERHGSCRPFAGGGIWMAFGCAADC